MKSKKSKVPAIIAVIVVCAAISRFGSSDRGETSLSYQRDVQTTAPESTQTASAISESEEETTLTSQKEVQTTSSENAQTASAISESEEETTLTSQKEVQTTAPESTQTASAISESEEETSPAETSGTVNETDIPTEKAPVPKGIRPEFKEAMDSYEEFYDKYCEFMKQYMENPLDLSLLAAYSEYIAKAEEMDAKLEVLDDGEMSDEELKYYLEVTTRVTTKLFELY